MLFVLPTRTTLTSAGLIVRLTAAALCAVVCSWAAGQEASSQSADAIVWESSAVGRPSQNAQETPSETAPPINSTGSSIEWTSNVDSTGGLTADSRFDSRGASNFGPNVNTNAVISPRAFHQARSTAQTQAPAIAKAPAKAMAPTRAIADTRSSIFAPIKTSNSIRLIYNDDRTEKISTRDLAAEIAVDLIDPSSLERPVKERGPTLLPVENYPSRITLPTANTTATPVANPVVAPVKAAPARISKPMVSQHRIEQSIIELTPPAPSEPSIAKQPESNDFPISMNSSTEPAKPASPFRFASTRKMAQELPALPPLPGQATKGDSKTSAAKTAANKKKKKKAPGVLASADSFVLAEQPQVGDHYYEENPQIDPHAWKSESHLSDFSPDPINHNLPADPWAEIQVYEGKTLNANQRPLVELGRPWYQLGPLSPGSSLLGFHNNLTPQFLVYGDFRSAIASNQLGGNSESRTASELNLDIDLKLTGTERFHAFVSPLDDGVNNTGYSFDDDEFIDEFDAQIDFGYFEGDLGAIVGGAIGKTLPFDLPFTIGEIPLVVQNGIWLEDAFLGFAATIPARNSPRFDISNIDITFFAGYDKINSDAFSGDDSAAKVYGVASFIEANNGYWEIDYAFLEDRTFDDRSYHNIGIGFTRRYGRLLSNSTRIIVNAGQSTEQVENTADGVLLLSENSLITGSPSTVVPYLNFFAGFDRPQSVARAAQAGGVLRNTGILFETDGMTGFPTLDPTANDTFGMALGLNLLPNDFSQQLVVEAALLGVMNDDPNRNAQGDQYGLGVRYQLPLTNAIIFRSDAMVGFRRNDEDINGVRMELRHKF